MRNLKLSVMLLCVVLFAVGCVSSNKGGRLELQSFFGTASAGSGSKVTVETSGNESIEVRVNAPKTETDVTPITLEAIPKELGRMLGELPDVSHIPMVSKKDDAPVCVGGACPVPEVEEEIPISPINIDALPKDISMLLSEPTGK